VVRVEKWVDERKGGDCMMGIKMYTSHDMIPLKLSSEYHPALLTIKAFIYFFSEDSTGNFVHLSVRIILDVASFQISKLNV
jgi:hypothetical protein